MNDFHKEKMTDPKLKRTRNNSVSEEKNQNQRDSSLSGKREGRADASAWEKKEGRKKRLFILSAAVVVGVVIAAVLYWHVYLRRYVSTNDAYIDGNRIAVSSKIMGRIVRLTVDEGNEVKRGQLLVQLDASTLEAQRSLAEANISVARQNVKLARASLSLVQEDYDRAAAQFKEKVTTQSQYDHALNALEMAQIKYNLALDQAKSAGGELNVIQAQLSELRITSPIDGVVAKRWAFTGDIVQPGQPILTVYDNGGIWVTVNLEETKISSIHLGDSVRIRLDAYSQEKYSGKVILIGAATASQFSLIPPDNASGNFTRVTQRIPLRVSIDNAKAPAGKHEKSLLPGMSASIKVKVK
jgi:membrane fusion protein (multidrug efflux system)